MSGCIALSDLDCGNNQLSSLDVSGCTALTGLSCYANRIPLSVLYEAYNQLSSPAIFYAANQSDTIILLERESFDLSSERVIDQVASTYKLMQHWSGWNLANNGSLKENGFVFQFYADDIYRLELNNLKVKDQNGPVTFTWYIRVNENPDGVDNEAPDKDNFRVYAQDRVIYLSADRGGVEVYNALGQCVYNGHATAIPVRNGGLYIVRVGGNSYKVMVR